MIRTRLVAICQIALATLALSAANGQEQVKVRISWGHTSTEKTAFQVQLAGREVTIAQVVGTELEADDRIEGAACETRAGKGDVDSVTFALQYAPLQVKPNEKVHQFWRDFIAQSDADTVRRLRQDPAYRPDPRVLTIRMDRDGTRGFSVTIDQLLRNKIFWVPSHDVYIAVGDAAPSFAEHQDQLKAYRGRRVLEQIQCEPEATYEQYTSRWEDTGSPAYKHPSQPAPGHIVGLTWDGTLHKFGIDRGAGVWNDYGNPDRFRFRFDFGDLSRGLGDSWKGQRLKDGLPVITTTIERDDLRYEVEQFAYPLHGPPAERRGNIPMVLLQKVMLTDVQGRDGPISVMLRHRRQFDPCDTSEIAWRQEDNAIVFEENTTHRVLFVAQGTGLKVTSFSAKDEWEQPGGKEKRRWKSCEAALTLERARQAGEAFTIKLPSPMVGARDRDTLIRLDYSKCREATLQFWADWVGGGAQFRVPEKAVNDLFRANLWHALRLPRRHGGSEEGVRIDLPYSNFAYDQNGTPWPVNQAVYVDYMIYGLRGYHEVAAEELLTIFRNNQEQNGHVKGYANWGVYTPSMVYTVAKNYLLSGDRQTFDKLLPYTLKALDWCLAQVQEASRRGDAARGLIRSPLNDLTGNGVWAFTQAYIYAAFEALGKALEQAGHPRARECFEAAASFRTSVERAFGAATLLSPLVQLRDHTWMPYVPCEATKPGRLFEQWYPTDVDTGAMHLLRLKALPAEGVLANALLNDHEDNLYLHGWGMANEPVYNPQATAYLLRDDPKAAIRAFYSYLACAFSHSVLEPVEHRWTWGQYFGPPSTDGAWFELYRNMLIHELDDGSLLLLQATPRRWLTEGERITVERAPTNYGDVSLTLDSHATSGSLTARIEMPKRLAPSRLIVRFRHPEARPMQSVTVNGQNWMGFDAKKEWVVIDEPREDSYAIVTRYEQASPTSGDDVSVRELAEEVRGKGWIVFSARSVGSEAGDRDLFLCRPDGKYVLFTGNFREDGDPGNSGAPMGLMRLADAPIIAGESRELRALHPDARSGPVPALPAGWEPRWTFAEIPFDGQRSQVEERTDDIAKLAEELRDKGRIIFSAATESGDWDLFFMRPDGSDRRRITDTRQYNEAGARYSPDGRRLLYFRMPSTEKVDNNTYGTYELVIADSDGGNAVVYGSNYRWASWGPDGSQIACLDKKGIQIIDLVSRQVVRQIPRRGIVQQLVWSPDGKRFVGTANGLGVAWSIGCLDAQTGRIHAVSEIDRYNCTPDWLRDSEHVLYSRGIVPGKTGWAQLWMAKADGTERQLLYAEKGRHLYGGCVSPDGNYVLFTRSEVDLGKVDNSRTRMAIIRRQDTPMLGGPDESLRREFPEARTGPLLDLSWGWEPSWGTTDR